MSKAFTSEETPEVTSATRPPPRLAPGEQRYVTPEGHAALRAQVEALQEALAHAGDAALREDLARRLELAAGTLAATTVLGPDPAREGEASFGCWVTVVDEAGRHQVWRLVGPDEADARRGQVSVHAPVGRALLGCHAGDEIEVALPAGTRRYAVVDVSHGPPP